MISKAEGDISDKDYSDNKITKEALMPHVHDKNMPGGVRAPYPYEVPR